MEHSMENSVDVGWNDWKNAAETVSNRVDYQGAIPCTVDHSGGSRITAGA